MADYFTNFSIVINLASKAQQAYALDLADKASIAHRDEQLPADFPEALKAMPYRNSTNKSEAWVARKKIGVGNFCLVL